MLSILSLCVGGSEDALVRTRCTYAISRKKQPTWKIFLLIRHKNIQMID